MPAVAGIAIQQQPQQQPLQPPVLPWPTTTIGSSRSPARTTFIGITSGTPRTSRTTRAEYGSPESQQLCLRTGPHIGQPSGYQLCCHQWDQTLEGRHWTSPERAVHTWGYSFKVFLKTLMDHAMTCGWGNILTYPSIPWFQVGPTQSILTHYGQVTLDQVRAHATMYINAQTCTARTTSCCRHAWLHPLHQKSRQRQWSAIRITTLGRTWVEWHSSRSSPGKPTSTPGQWSCTSEPSLVHWIPTSLQSDATSPSLMPMSRTWSTPWWPGGKPHKTS